MPLINHAYGGGGTPQLCAQVENFRVIPGILSAILSWKAPEPDEDNSFVGARIVRKTGSAPNGINDGTVVYEGTALSYTDTGLTNGTTYYYRAFAYNDKRKYQTAKKVVSLVAIAVDSTLNNNEWNVIKLVSDAGQGANYWSIGDRKAVTLNGTVGKLSLSNVTTYAFIIGFNHNEELEGSNRIHFQIGKTALSGGTDVCLCDSAYPTNISATGYFSMNRNATNSGGWAKSQMRTNICGTSLSSYFGTIIAVIPAALRAVLKSVTKYTNNTGDSSVASAVTATTDYFFLLSEFEVFGSISHANKNEKSKQAQYAYYSAGNSKIKYKHDDISTAATWRLRSPLIGTSWQFVSVDADGKAYASTAETSLGFAPCFCV